MESSLIQLLQHFEDDILALEIESEKLVLDTVERYKDLPNKALYTSFNDLKNIFESIHVTGTWIDIGGGSGRTCLYYSLLKNRKSINVEIDNARSLITDLLAERYHLDAKAINLNLLDFPIPVGDTFFLYFPTGKVLDKVLFELRQRSEFTLVVVESHGDLLDRIFKENSYELVEKILLNDKRHNPYAHIFKKKSPLCIEVLPFDLSFQDRLLILKDELGYWIGSSLNLEWLGDQHFNLMYPPRTIHWENDFAGFFENTNKNLFLISNIDKLRRLENLEFVLKDNSSYQGIIRKIRLDPTLMLELSTSQLIEWDKIVLIKKGSQICFESAYFYF